MKLVVLDSSATMSFFIPDESKTISFTEKLEKLLDSAPIIVPSIWQYETNNVLISCINSRRINQQQANNILILLEKLDISIDEESQINLSKHTFHLALEHKLTIYDAAYLELAIRHNGILASLDKALIKAAKHAGVELI